MFDDSSQMESKIHIEVKKSGKKRLFVTRKQIANIRIKGTPNDFIVIIFTGKSVYFADVSDFVLGDFETGLWSDIKMKIDIMKNTA
jgi:hypothetical protein